MNINASSDFYKSTVIIKDILYFQVTERKNFFLNLQYQERDNLRNTSNKIFGLLNSERNVLFVFKKCHPQRLC